MPHPKRDEARPSGTTLYRSGGPSQGCGFCGFSASVRESASDVGGGLGERRGIFR